MPKIRPRKTNKAQWTSETLQKAEELMNQGQSMRYAAKAMGIPFSSLQKRLKKKDPSEPRLGRLPVFTLDTEKNLADRIKYLSSIFYGVTATQIRKAAYQYAEKLQIQHKFDQSAQMAGREWLEGFLKRNGISIRKPEATSINRITAFNKEEVQLFYKLLGDLMDKHTFTPKNIYNCDETGISTVQDPGKILAPKGMKRVGSITSWERGKNITLLCAMNAAGGYVPPMFIFPRKRMTPQLEKDGPAGAIYKCSDNGWINENLFFEWLQHFANHAKPSSQEPVLLILDNHASHASLMAYDFCKQNHIHMLSLPPHTSHRMQPLDLTFFGPLKAAYKKECDLFLKNRLAEKITPYDVAAILNKAYSIVASINKGESGFQAAGIVPYNPDHFTEEDFTAAEVLAQPPVIIIQDSSMVIPSTTDSIDPMTALSSEAIIPVPSTSSAIIDPVPSTSSAAIEPVPSTSSAAINPLPSTSSAAIEPVPSTSSAAINPLPSTSSAVIDPVPSTSRAVINIANLLPFPTQTNRERPVRKGQIKQHAKILTSTPVKDSLIEKENKKAAKAAKTSKGKNVAPKAKGKQNKQVTNKAKRRVLQEMNTSSESEISLSKICDDDDDDDLNKCLVCVNEDVPPVQRSAPLLQSPQYTGGRPQPYNMEFGSGGPPPPGMMKERHGPPPPHHPRDGRGYGPEGYGGEGFVPPPPMHHPPMPPQNQGGPPQQGAVMMVYGLDPQTANADRLFNLCCLYGNVVRIKFLKTKEGTAMVQMGDGVSVERCVQNLNNVTVGDYTLTLAFSKQAYLSEVMNPYPLPDKSPSFKDYVGNKNNRFLTPASIHKNRIQPPSKVLHFFNTPPDVSDDQLLSVFNDYGVKPPHTISKFPLKSERSSSGLMEFQNISQSVMAIMACNHATIQHPGAKFPFVMKLCFSSSRQIGQGKGPQSKRDNQENRQGQNNGMAVEHEY